MNQGDDRHPAKRFFPNRFHLWNDCGNAAIDSREALSNFVQFVNLINKRIELIAAHRNVNQVHQKKYNRDDRIDPKFCCNSFFHWFFGLV